MKLTKKLLTLALICLTAVAFALPVSADVVVTPYDYIAYTPLGWILAGILIAIVVLVTVLLIRFYFGKNRRGHDDDKNP